MRVLVTGIAGTMGRLVAERLLATDHQVIGVDRRPWRDCPSAVRMHEADVRKRAAEEVFRLERPDAVIHMATIAHVRARSSDEGKAEARDRYRINLQGTRAVFDHCREYGVKQAIFVGRHTYYGAAPDSPLYHTENEPPMALETFPELADLVAADLYAGQALWRMPEVATAVLRIVYTLGPHRHGTLAAFLSGPRVPTILGFDPLYQFMHETDAARAIVAALDGRVRGVFNVCGPQPLPLSVIVRACGRTPLPVPEPAYRLLLGRFGLPSLPRGALGHIKYPVVVDGTAFRRATGFEHGFDAYQTMDAFRSASRSVEVGA